MLQQKMNICLDHSLQKRKNNRYKFAIVITNCQFCDENTKSDMEDKLLGLVYETPMFIGLLGALILFLKPNRKTPHKVLAINLLNMSLVALSMFFYSLESFSTQYWADILLIFSTMNVAPLYFLYIRSLTAPRGLWLRKDLTAFLPMVFFVTVNLALYLIMGPTLSRYYMRVVELNGNFPVNAPLIFHLKIHFGSYIYRLAMLLQTVWAIVYSFSAFARFHRIEADYYSNQEEGFLNRLDMVKYAYLTLVVCTILLAAFPYSVYHNAWIFLLIVSLLATGMMVLFILYGWNQPTSSKELTALINDTQNTVQLPPRTAGYQESILENLRKFESERGYLNASLTIVELAEMIHTNRTYLAETIKDRYSRSFSDYINGLRIEYAKQLMLSMPENEVIIKTIAIQSGYNSVTNFHRNFVKIMGKSATDWLKEQH